MSAVNAGQLLILVWTFTAVCQADDNHVSVSCADVSGTVGEEVTLACSVSLSQNCTERRIITLYKFQYLENHRKSEICREEFPQSSCEQRNSFPCRFTPNATMTGQFRFFVQTQCGQKTSEFTVSITEPSKLEAVTSVVFPESENSLDSRNTVITAVTGCLFIIIIIIIIITTMTIIYKRKSNNGRQWTGFLSRRRDEENSVSPEDMS